jgi:hypothetical protein
MPTVDVYSEAAAAAAIIEKMYDTTIEGRDLHPLVIGLGKFERFNFQDRFRCIDSALLLTGGARGAAIIMSGTNRFANNGNVAAGYASVRLSRNSFGGNANMMEDAIRYWDGGVSEQIPQNVPISLYGHSAGGGTVECLARYIRRTRGNPIRCIITMGSPKPGLAGMCVEELEIVRRRFMMFGDPVPLVPEGNVAPRVYIALLVGGQDYQPNLYRHGSGGLVIGRGLPYSRVDAQCNGSAARHLEDWMNRTGTAGAFHSISVYHAQLAALNRLYQSDKPAPPPPPPSPAQGQEGQRFVLDFQQFVPVVPGSPIPVATVQGSTVVVAGRPNGTAYPNVRRAMAQSKVSPFLQMTRSSVNGLYLVFWNDFFIATFPTPSSARTFCRAGNRFLRVCGNRGTIHQQTFVDGFNSWLTIAAQVGGGVNPPIRVD